MCLKNKKIKQYVFVVCYYLFGVFLISFFNLVWLINFNFLDYLVISNIYLVIYSIIYIIVVLIELDYKKRLKNE